MIGKTFQRHLDPLCVLFIKRKCTRCDQKVPGLILYKFIQKPYIPPKGSPPAQSCISPNGAFTPGNMQKMCLPPFSVVTPVIFVLFSQLYQVFVARRGTWSWEIKKSARAKSGQYGCRGRTVIIFCGIVANSK